MPRNGDNLVPRRRRGSNASSASRHSNAPHRRRNGSHSSTRPLPNGTAQHDSNDPSFNVRSLSAHPFPLPMTAGGRGVMTATTASDSGVGEPSTTTRRRLPPAPIAEEQLNVSTLPVDRGTIGDNAREPTTPPGASVMDIDLGGPPVHLDEYVAPEYSGCDVDLAGMGARFSG